MLGKLSMFKGLRSNGKTGGDDNDNDDWGGGVVMMVMIKTMMG